MTVICGPTKTIERGSGVSFIQKASWLRPSQTKIMPPSGGRDVRFIRPYSRLASVSATSTFRLTAPCLALICTLPRANRGAPGGAADVDDAAGLELDGGGGAAVGDGEA